MKQSEKLISTIMECAEQLKEMGVKMEKYVPKKGDFCLWSWEDEKGDGAENYCIFGEYPYCLFITNKSAKGNVVKDSDSINLEIKLNCHYIIRPLTEAEKQIVLDRLHKHGKDWDSEKMEFVDWKWRAKMDGKYWYLDSFGDVGYSIEENHNGDAYRFNCGNYFKTKEEAEAYRQYCLAYKKS